MHRVSPFHDDSIQEFDTRCDEVPLSLSKIPSDGILESLYTWRIRESAQLKTVLELCDMEIHQKKIGLDFHRLKTMVKRSIGQKFRLRNFDARHARTKSGAVVKNRKVLIGVEGSTSVCNQRKEKGQCSQGDRCNFRHETQNRVQKTRTHCGTLSEPAVSRGRSVSRERSIRGNSNRGSILRQPCRYNVIDTCTLTSCVYWHPTECKFYRTETGCKAGDKCLFQHYKVDEQPNQKRPRRESDDKNAVAVVKCLTIGLCITNFSCTGFSTQEVSGKPDASLETH